MHFVHMFRLIIFLFLVVAIIPSKVHAIVDPLAVPNNSFGIHIIDDNDIPDASKLVNSNGGDWGYVTLVIQDTDLDINKWQMIFDKLRDAHLIPLIRLSTHAQGQNWVKPSVSEAERWAEFLSSLNWVVKNRYIILFNEPNHAKEWGGTINPAEYAKIARAFHTSLKQKSSDFYILPAGFDSSAPNSNDTQDMTSFLKKMTNEDPVIFSLFDGWNSHSYPNPAFRGSPNATGRGTVRSWEWELNLVQSLGLKNVPVFITETGWVHFEGKNPEVSGLSSDTVGKFYQEAFKNAWNNKKIVAVTPFILNYQDKPFDNFSFKKMGDNGYYSQFDAIVELDKTRGMPIQEINSKVVKSNIPSVLIENSHYIFNVIYKNVGQATWSSRDDYALKVNNLLFGIKDNIKPGQEGSLPFEIDTQKDDLVVNITLVHNAINFGQEVKEAVYIIPSPTIILKPTIIFGNLEDIQIQFLSNNELVKTIKQFDKIDNGLLKTADLYNLVPNREYEVKLIKDGYTSSKTKILIKEGENKISFFPNFPKSIKFLNEITNWIHF